MWKTQHLEKTFIANGGIFNLKVSSLKDEFSLSVWFTHITTGTTMNNYYELYKKNFYLK